MYTYHKLAITILIGTESIFNMPAFCDSWGSQTSTEHALKCICSKRSCCPAASAWEPVVKLYLHNIETLSNSTQLYKCTCLHVYAYLFVCVHICLCVPVYMYLCMCVRLQNNMDKISTIQEPFFVGRTHKVYG